MKIQKHVQPGRTLDGDLFITIQYKDGRLSITGVEGPMSNGNAHGGCGQVTEALRRIDVPAPGWTSDDIIKLREVWDRWHLNDMRAGSQAQEDWLRANPIPPSEYAYPRSHYEVASAKLQAAGLNPDAEGYRYGHAWKREEIPQDVLMFLEGLPVADKPLPDGWGRF